MLPIACAALVVRMRKRLAAAEDGIKESCKLAAAALSDLLTAHDELRVARSVESYLRGVESDLRKDLAAALVIHRKETERQRRVKQELRKLRERLAVYEAPVDEAELAERIHAVEAEHAVFDAAERGDLSGGFASWCGNCEAFIVAIRKLHSAARSEKRESCGDPDITEARERVADLERQLEELGDDRGWRWDSVDGQREDAQADLDHLIAAEKFS